MKKFMSIMLTMGLMASSMNMVSAASATATDDIQDKHVKEAVDRLMAFGIVNGMEDGKYHPEMKVTREQFAKIMVEALGLADAAKATQSAPLFTDIESSRWSAGYISVAIGEGILKGYPDGTFRPTKEVSYAEAVTMLVRGLGYKDEFLSGAAWPHNYIAKAASEGVTSHVDFDTTGTSDRGSVAVMVNNTLDADTISASEYANATFGNTTYSKSGKTLLEDKLEIVKVEDASITGTPKVDRDVDDDQIKFKTEDDYKSLDIEEDEDVIFDVQEGIDLNSYLGETVNVYINDDDEVVYFEETARDTDAFYGVIDVESEAIETIVKDGKDIDDALEDELTIFDALGDDKDYDLADEDDLKIFVDNKEVDFEDFAKMVKESGNNVFAKFIKDNKGKIATIDAQIFEELAAMATKTSDDEIRFRKDNADSKDDDSKLEFGDDEDIERVIVMDVEGKEMSVDDIKEDDVLYINKNLSELDNGSIDSDDDLKEQASKDVVAYVVVVRNTVEGALKAFNQEDNEVKIGSDKYDVDGKQGTVSSNENKDIYKFSDERDGADALDALSADNDEVLAFRGINGDLVHIQGKAESSSSDKYAVIYGRKNDTLNPEVDLMLADGTKKKGVEIDFEEDEFIGYDKASDFGKDEVVGDVIKYTMNSDGEIDHAEKVAELDEDMDIHATNEDFEDDYKVVEEKLTDDFEDDEMEVDDDSYAVRSNVTVFEFTDVKSLNTVDEVEIVDFKKLEDKGDGEEVIAFYNDDEEVELIILKSSISSDDELVGYVVNSLRSDSEAVVDMYAYDENEDGEDAKLEEDLQVEELNGSSTNEDSYKDIDNRAVIYTKDSTGDLEVFTTQEDFEKEFDDSKFEFVTGVVKDKSGKNVTLITIDGEKVNFDVESDTVIVEDEDLQDSGDIDEDDNQVITVIKEGRDARVIKIYDMEDSLDRKIAKEHGYAKFDDLKDDAEDLLEKIEDDYDEDDYTTDSWEKLEDAIDEMKDAMDDDDEDIAELASTIADVKEKLNNLEEKDNGGGDDEIDADDITVEMDANITGLAGKFTVKVSEDGAEKYTVETEYNGTKYTSEKTNVGEETANSLFKSENGEVEVTLYDASGDEIGTFTKEYEVK